MNKVVLSKQEKNKVEEMVGQGKHWFAGKLVPL